MHSKPVSIKAETQRMMEQQLFRLLFEQASAVTILTDEHAHIIRASTSLEQLLGKSVRGLTLYELLVDFQGTLDIAEICRRENDGQTLHFSTDHGLPSSYRFFGRRVGKYYLLYAETNEAELRHFRKEMLNLNAEMHDMSRELQRRNVQLEQLSKLKNQFLGMAAHDLRNPLSVVMSFSEVLLDDVVGVLTDDQREIVATMHESSQFMLTLINNLLDISAIESGHLTLDRTPVHFDKLLRKNLARNRFLAAKKNIDIVEEIADDPPRLLLDAAKCEQVLNNLVTNAVKFSDAGTVISVTCRVINGELLLSVTDQGQGIPDDELGALFEPFARTSVRSTAGETSTGLGLAIVKRILDGHDASIAVRSVVGVGTTFMITFPHHLIVENS
ncbi:MAG: PAS domain-containing sensor histidine kinase [Bacteroidetes bacterium]|nr:PAS domain-containing sensor histidine kinase [Bacteroidota bacterium]